jgi:hypothetical protein
MNLEPEVADNLLRCQHNPVPHAPPPPSLPHCLLHSCCLCVGLKRAHVYVQQCTLSQPRMAHFPSPQGRAAHDCTLAASR